MADTKTIEEKVSIRVFVDKVKKKVVYAEADYTFVDILFSFLTLPMGTIVTLMGKHAENKFEVLGSLNNLYQSLKDFPDCYLATEECKFMLLNPRIVAYDHCRNLKLKIDDTEPLKYYICECCWRTEMFFSVCDTAKCGQCGRLMSYSCTSYDNVSSCGSVFVFDIATFIVTDDFSVIPYTVEGCFRLLSDFGITDMSPLEERKIDMDGEQILYLLRLALKVDFPFTHFVFGSCPHNFSPFGYFQHTTVEQGNHKKNETSNVSNMLLKVYLQKSTGKLLLAEANEDFVDFLFGFLSIPLGTVIGELMNGASSLRCLDNLFRSTLNISVGRYLKSQNMKDMLVKPQFGQEYVSVNQVFHLQVNGSSCKLSHRVYRDVLRLKDPRIDEAFLRKFGMFIVTDDLVIAPLSSHLAMTTLSKLKVPFDDVEKCEISIGLEEASRMVRASLKTNLTLTSSLKHLLKK